MARPTSLHKVWLSLSLAVLLLHLALLQTQPLSLSSEGADPPKMAFAVRTVVPQPQAATPLARLAANTTARPPGPKPAHAAAPSAASENAAVSVAGTSMAGAVPMPAASAPQPDDGKLAVAPQEAASALVPSEPDLASAARPPRAKATPFNADGLPASAKLIYKVLANKFPYNLSGELVWQQADQKYQASLSFGAFGQTRTQTSRGHIGPNGLEPERFSDKYRGEVAAHFNWSQGKVTFSANTPDAPLLSGAQDRLSVLVQLAALVAGAPQHFSVGTTLTLQTVGPRDADLWLFTVGNIESLVLPGGTVQGLKLTRNPRHQYDQQVDIWLAPSLGYLPARIRILEANGDFIDQQWQATEPVGPP
jgi:hypothetical protein